MQFKMDSKQRIMKKKLFNEMAIWNDNLENINKMNIEAKKRSTNAIMNGLIYGIADLDSLDTVGPRIIESKAKIERLLEREEALQKHGDETVNLHNKNVLDKWINRSVNEYRDEQKAVYRQFAELSEEVRAVYQDTIDFANTLLPPNTK